MVKRQVPLQFGAVGGVGRGNKKTECFEDGGEFGSAFVLFSRSTKHGKALPEVTGVGTQGPNQ